MLRTARRSIRFTSKIRIHIRRKPWDVSRMLPDDHRAHHDATYNKNTAARSHFSTPLTHDLYDLYDLYDLDLAGRADLSRYCMNLAHVAVWDPYNVRDLHVSWVGSVLYADPAQHITMAGQELHDL